MQNKQNSKTASFKCPGCGASGSIREIVYGMPGSDFEFDKYIVGGCCVTDNDPDIGCKECGWEGFSEKKDVWAGY